MLDDQAADSVGRQVIEPPYGETRPLWIEKVTGRQRRWRQMTVRRQVVVPVEKAPQLLLVEHGSWTSRGLGSRLFRTLASAVR